MNSWLHYSCGGDDWGVGLPTQWNLIRLFHIVRVNLYWFDKMAYHSDSTNDCTLVLLWSCLWYLQ